MKQIYLVVRGDYNEPLAAFSDKVNAKECVRLFEEKVGATQPSSRTAVSDLNRNQAMISPETNRDVRIHPLLKEYLNQAGYLALNPEDGEKLWCGPAEGLTVDEIRERTELGNAVGSLVTQFQMVYSAVVTRLQEWLEAKGLEPRTAQQQAQAAARYYLPHGLVLDLPLET